jgi:hypothetical protein
MSGVFRKRLFLLLFSVTAILAFYRPAVGDDLIEVTARGRGANEEEAVVSALDEAIRYTLGAIFAERSELGEDVLEEKLIQFSRGAATNYKVIESTSDELGVTAIVLVTVDSRKIKENARTLKEGTGAGGVERRQTPLMDEGQRLLSKSLAGKRYENYLSVRLTEKRVDARKGTLDLSVVLGFDQERYFREFARPLAGTLDGIFASSALRGEIDGEFESPEDRYYVAFEVLDENYSSKIWMLPQNFFDTMKRTAGFWVASKGRIATHKRLWLHFSLLGANGEELERIPIPLNVSNVIFFSENREESPNPWFFMDLVADKTEESPVVIAAPYYGVTSNNKYSFFKEYEQQLSLKLPEKFLERMADVKVALELER